MEEKTNVGLLRDHDRVVSNVVTEKQLDQYALTLKTAVDLCRSSVVTGQLLMGRPTSAINEYMQCDK